MKPFPFRIEVPEETVTRIAERVRTARFPMTSKGAGWKYGVKAAWFAELVGYWSERFDWRAVEARLNQTPQFRVSIEGRDVHFAHLQPKPVAVKRPPILLLHGWPHTFATMLPLGEQLSAGWL